jgi:predicted  nucleic acid-binding Zn-ribbon protein
MAAQFAKPSKNMMENIASGAAVFAEGAAEEERSRRLADLELKKALYQYDVAAAEDERDTAAAGLKARTDIATGQMNDIRRQQDNIIEDIQSIRSDVTRYGRDPQEAEATIKVLKERFDALGQKLGAYESYISEQYGFSSIPSVDTANEKINYPTR